jgi:hypothetical protein
MSGDDGRKPRRKHRFRRHPPITGVIFGAGSFSFGLYCWPLGEAAAAGGALARCEAAAGGALARREEEAAGGALARREEEAAGGALARREEAVGEALARRVAVREEPGVLRGPPVVLRVLSEPAAGQEVYVEPGAEEPEYAGPVAVAF